MALPTPHQVFTEQDGALFPSFLSTLKPFIFSFSFLCKKVTFFLFFSLPLPLRLDVVVEILEPSSTLTHIKGQHSTVECPIFLCIFLFSCNSLNSFLADLPMAEQKGLYIPLIPISSLIRAFHLQRCQGSPSLCPQRMPPPAV